MVAAHFSRCVSKLRRVKERKNWLYYYDHTQKKDAGQVRTKVVSLLAFPSSFASN
jgi:hypothetical protein